MPVDQLPSKPSSESCSCASVIAEGRNIARHLLRERGIGEKHLVIVIHQLADGIAFPCAPGFRAPRASRHFSNRHGASADTLSY
jgi:hypothetical protein